MRNLTDFMKYTAAALLAVSSLALADTPTTSNYKIQQYNTNDNTFVYGNTAATALDSDMFIVQGNAIKWVAAVGSATPLFAIISDGTNATIDASGGVGDVIVTPGLNKTLALSTPAYEDQQINISSVRLPTSQAPTWTSYKGSEILAFGSNERIYFTAQLSHKYAIGEDIEFHIHIALPSSATSGDAMEWTFTHSWASIGAVFPAETTVVTESDLTGDLADEHGVYDVVATIDGTGKGISSILLCSLIRTVPVATDYGSDLYLTAADFHIPVDTLGSRQEGVK